MTGFMEDGLLRMLGLDDNDIANLNKIIPDAQNLLTVAQSHQAQFNRVLTVAIPIAQKILAKERTMT